MKCQACNGEGLKDEATLCPECKGLGKVSPEGARFPEGTLVLKQDGAFVVRDGALVKDEQPAPVAEVAPVVEPVVEQVVE